MKSMWIFILVAVLSFSFTYEKPAYQLFDVKGKKANYKKLLKSTEDADIILFGELHNNPINHWLQLELSKDIYEQVNTHLVLGAEMFEADDQTIINEFLSGEYDVKSFEKEVKLWTNYKTDYKPLMDFAKQNNLHFVATNIPRRYANMVYLGGFEALNSISEMGKQSIAPLPILYDGNLPGYQKMIEMAAGHGGENLPKAQAIKDATMAYFILQNWEKGQTFIHYNGTYHSNNFEGIHWYLKQAKPELKILTIAAIEQDGMENLDETDIGIADFVICTPSSMTKTY